MIIAMHIGAIAIEQILSPSQPENVGKKVIFQNCSLFTDYISEINNTQIDNVIHIDVIMPIYNLLEYSNNYSKASGGLWQYYRDEASTDAGTTTNFHANDNSVSFKPNQGITSVIDDYGTKNVKIMVPLKYLSNFWRTVKISLINCEINFILTCSKKCVLSNDTKATTFAITDTKLMFQL